MLDWSNPARKYAEMALDLVRLMGVKNGSIPVISKASHPQQWRDWYAYYDFRRLLGSQDMMRVKDARKTVPTLSPFDFDAEFHLSGPSPEVPYSPPPSTRTPRFMIEAEKAKVRNADRPVLFTNVSYDEFRVMSRGLKIPIGAIWCASLGTVFGPKPQPVSQAAE